MRRHRCLILCLTLLAMVSPACGGGKAADSSTEACTLQGDTTSDDSWSGDAFVQAPGDQEVDSSLSLQAYRFDTPFFIDFTADGGQSLLICGGEAFTGSRSTSNTLGLRVDVTDGTNEVTMTSSGGECTVFLSGMSLQSVEGQFDCPELTDDSASGQTFSISGEFSASSPFGSGDSTIP